MGGRGVQPARNLSPAQFPHGTGKLLDDSTGDSIGSAWGKKALKNIKDAPEIYKLLLESITGA